MAGIIDLKYDIRLATINDIPDIMRFIDESWGRGHILSYNRELFEYEFLDGSSVNMILGVSKDTGEIEGLYGFIKASKQMKDIWGSIWKVRSGNIPTLGIEIFRRMQGIIHYRYHVDLGLNLDTSAILFKKVFKWKVERMIHYYVLAPREEYSIAKADSCRNKCNSCIVDDSFDVYLITEPDDDFNRFTSPDQIPYKDSYYIKKRYFEHPIYKYDVYGIEKNNILYALFVLRRETFKGRHAYRMVDYIGDHSVFRYCRRIVDKMLMDPDVEYVDFYCYGIDEKYISEAGFEKIVENDTTIIPNYFYPFVQKNIDIWIQIPEIKEGYTPVYCKADGDQDRPN